MNAPSAAKLSRTGSEQPRGARATEGLALARSVDSIERSKLDPVLDRLSRPDRPTILAFVNAHAFNLAWEDRRFGAALMRADTLFRDGSGMAILCRMLGVPKRANLNGTDTIPKVLERFAGRRVALFGTREPWLGRAAERVRESGVEVVAAADGFQPLDNYVPLARAAEPDLVILGLGMPRQEFLACRLADELEHPCLIIAGGAILDFWAKRFARAPVGMRALGFEWVFRLAREPKRLWRRYLVGNPVFLWRALRVRQAARALGGSRGT